LTTETISARTMSPANKSNVVGVCDAKNRLSQLLDRVERGDIIVITRRGTPVARLVPYEERLARADAVRAAEALREFRRGNRIPKGLSIRAMIREGRR
jgi:prevent-host-death family protein